MLLGSGSVLGLVVVLAVSSSWSGVEGAPEGQSPLAYQQLQGQEEAGFHQSSSALRVCHINQYTRKWSPDNYSVSVNLTKCSPGSCKDDKRSKPWLGYIGAIIAIIFFGSNFVPVKKYETGDGIFYQWIMCIGIWLVGLVVNLSLDSPIFFIPTIVGGFLWTTGNMLVVPIIQMIGLTMGLTVWGVTNMLSGWVVGRFILHQSVACDGLNYAGVATVVLSVFILAFVKSEGKGTAEATDGVPTEQSALLGERTASLEGSLKERVTGCCMNIFKLQRSAEQREVSRPPTSINASSEKVVFSSSVLGRGTSTAAEPQTHESWVDKLGKWHKRILGFGLSLIAGMVFSFLFLPVQFLKLCDDGHLQSHSCNDLDYLFGVYSGILLTSTFYMFVYAAITGNRPKIYPKVIFPGIISGLLWGIAMAGWFLANDHLSTSISFPLVTAGPGFISSLWGILVYREIKGWKNILLFFVAFLVSLAGLVMNGLSKCTECGHHHTNTTLF